MAEPSTVAITVWPNHRVTVEPFVPELVDVLAWSKTGFRAGGPFGHAMASGVELPHAGRVRHRVRDAGGGYRTLDGAHVPLGRLPLVRTRLRELDYVVDTVDRRSDSPRWVMSDAAFREVSARERELVVVVQAERAIGVVAPNDGQVVETVVTLAKVFPGATFAIAVVSREQLHRVERRMRAHLDEPLGRYTADKRIPGRVAVGLMHQLPRGTKGECEVLVLPYAETLSEEAVRIALSGHYRRIVAFTRSAEIRDEGVRRRLEVITAGVWPARESRPPASVVLLSSHGTRPAGPSTDPLDEKRQLYWKNVRRNRRIAAVATRLVTGSKRSVRAVLGTAGEPSVSDVTAAAKRGVAVLVETPEHAHALAELLPGWAAWAASDEAVTPAKAGCGVIATELGASETVVPVGVVIRATGTKWPLPRLHWPNGQDVSSGVLIDFADTYHPQAARHAVQRFREYTAAGMTILATEETVRAEPPDGHEGRRRGGKGESGTQF